MDVTRRCDYACRILRAAYKSGEAYVSVSDIAEQEDIPYAFARSIQHDLVKGGLIKTVRGARGGLALNCDPAAVTLLEVLEAVQGPVSISLCVMDPAYCDKQKDCAYNKLWQGADRLLNAYFGAITLKDLIEQGASHPVVEAAMAKAKDSDAVPAAVRCAAQCAAPTPRIAAEAPGSVAWPSEALGRDEFVELVRREGARLHRDLPWRYIDDPYAVLVSEVMLQQTQVARVEKHWTRFLSLFPTIDSLAAAGTADVLAQWQGLGYNRRALALKRAAETCSAERGGLLPDTAEELETLPGIGPATAAGVMAFAYNRPSVYIETNVRTVFLHELFPDRDKVSDRELAPLVASTCPEDDARAWYYALLDYGAHLKTLVANPSRRSAHYARQSAFEGSRRQKRAELVRVVLAEPGIGADELAERLDAFERAAGRDGVDAATFESIVADLVSEGFFRREGGAFFA